MKDISLKDLLSAGCHFGHRVEKWHPKAAAFIYQVREKIHIIDLVKTRDSLKKAAEFVKDLGKEGKTLLFVGTKRQAKGVVSEAAKRAEAPYLTNRWIGGFITNWEEVKKNIEKLKNFRQEKADGSWEKFPKHEIVKLAKILRKIETIYGGVAQLEVLPDALFIVDIKKEESCLREAIRREIAAIAIVDTNTNPNLVNYPIFANDDAVGSIQYITNYLADAYIEGKKMKEKAAKTQSDKEEKEREKASKVQSDKEAKEKEEVKEEKPKKRGRPKKVLSIK